jgi:hypothetical protein
MAYVRRAMTAVFCCAIPKRPCIAVITGAVCRFVVETKKVLDAATSAGWNNLHDIFDCTHRRRCWDCDFSFLGGHDFRGDDGRHL